MVFAPLYLECLSGSDACAHSTASAAHVPLDIVAAVGDGVPVVVAFGIAGDGKHFPAAANFDAFDDVDSRQNVFPASRIFVDSKGDRQGLNDRNYRGLVEAGILWRYALVFILKEGVEGNGTGLTNACCGRQDAYLEKPPGVRCFGTEICGALENSRGSGADLDSRVDNRLGVDRLTPVLTRPTPSSWIISQRYDLQWAIRVRCGDSPHNGRADTY
jgi:hypothetical protein